MTKLTNQEAIELLNDRIGHLIASDPGYAERYDEACRMAVEALRVQEALEAMLKVHDRIDIYSDDGVFGVLSEADQLAEAPTLSAAILEARAEL